MPTRTICIIEPCRSPERRLASYRAEGLSVAHRGCRLQQRVLEASYTPLCSEQDLTRAFLDHTDREAWPPQTRTAYLGLVGRLGTSPLV